MLLGIGNLGALDPAGKDCAEIKEIYERESRLAKTRSKAEHRRRHKRNAERFEAAYNECQSEAPHVIPEAAGGIPNPLALLTSSAPGSPAASLPPQPEVDYKRLGLIVFGGVAVVGGLIWALSGKKPVASKPPERMLT